VVPGGLAIGPGDRLTTTSRGAPAFTMVVGDGDRLYALRHTTGEGAVALVERIDPRTLEPLATSVELAAGPVWPGATGEERARTPTDGGVQSVLFPAPGLGRDFYVCTFLALTRVEVVTP